MSRFIETIRASNGRLGDLRFHQQRVNETLQAFQASVDLSLVEILQEQRLPDHPISKIRITYTLQGLEKIEYEAYKPRSIQSLSFAAIGTQRYDFKYADRSWLQDLVIKATTDEVILCEDDIVKDASYANLAFYDGQRWFTPREPLLNGSKRRALVQEGLLVEQEIRKGDLSKYACVKLINAMMLWEESPTIVISNIVQ